MRTYVRMRMKAGGRGLEPRTLGPKPSVLSSYTIPQRDGHRHSAAPPRRRARSRSSLRAVTSFSAVVMAAGQGTRMRSATPKVLHEICGRPMVAWPVIAAQEAGAEAVVVVGSPQIDLSAALPAGTRTAIQPVPDGT